MQLVDIRGQNYKGSMTVNYDCREAYFSHISSQYNSKVEKVYNIGHRHPLNNTASLVLGMFLIVSHASFQYKFDLMVNFYAKVSRLIITSLWVYFIILF